MTTVEAQRTAGGRPDPWPLSVKAYRALGELGLIPKRTELLYGQVFAKMSKSPLHRFLVQRVLRLLRQAAPPGCCVWQEQPLTCGDSELEPDVCLIRGDEDDFLTEHPRTAELVIEVCISSREYDRLKLRAYARAGVEECWFVLGPERQIEVHRRPEGEGYGETRLYGCGESVTSPVVPGFTLELDGLFQR